MKIIRSISSTFALALIGIFSIAYVAVAVTQGSSDPAGTWKSPTLISAQTSSATSNPVSLLGARAATLRFASDGPNGSGNGTTTFSFQVSTDGSNYYKYEHLTTNNTAATKVSSTTITGTSSAIFTLDFTGESFMTGRCVSVEEGTTTATCSILVQN